MFSRRTSWELSENPLSLALAERKALGQGVLDLTESNPTRAGVGYPVEAILAGFSDARNLVYLPESKGLLHAREAVAAYFKVRGNQVPVERLILTASTSESYSFLFRLLADPHDRVLLPVPSYPLFAYLADINDVEPAYYQLDFDGLSWNIDLDSIEAAARKGRVKAVILVSPNNPTGSAIKPEELKALNVLCLRYGMAIISDEVFSDYLFGTAKERYISLASNTEVLSFSLGGLSKALALPQMKLGWIAANGPADVLSEALARLDVITDTYLSVNTPVQNACAGWLTMAGEIQQGVLRRVKGNLEFLTQSAEKAEVFLYPVDGGWYAVLRAELGMPEDEWAVALLKDGGVYVHPGFYFDFPAEGHIVLSLLPQPEIFEAGVDRLLAFLKS